MMIADALMHFNVFICLFVSMRRLEADSSCVFPLSHCQLIQFLFSQMQSSSPSTVGLKRKLWVHAKCVTPPKKKKKTPKKSLVIPDS